MSPKRHSEAQKPGRAGDEWRHSDQPDPNDPEFASYLECLRDIVNDYGKDHGRKVSKH
jgi:hypothetical protein